MAREDSPILLAGGFDDPNLGRLNQHLVTQRGVETIFLAAGRSANPSLTWDLESGELFLEGSVVTPQAVFIRHDVFAEEQSPRIEIGERAYAWYAAVIPWIERHPEVRVPNRQNLARNLWKPSVLLRAKACGLRVPRTLVSNDIPRVCAFAQHQPAIAKPIDGGDYCRKLDQVLHNTKTRDGAAAQPAIVQPELVPPEVRIFGVAGRFIAFQIHSNMLDYRADKRAEVELFSDVPPHIFPQLSALMNELGLDFCAADFKTCPDTRDLLFLEINDAPMFAMFDEAVGGDVADAIADLLLGRASAPCPAS